MLGTPAYMSPEQAKGELDRMDARSDLFSLGAILYEILTLERAIPGETTYAILANTLKGNLVPPEQRAPSRNVPRELSAIAMKCLHRGRAHRYRSVLDLKRDISLFLEGRSVSAAPDTFSQAFVKLIKRNKPVSASIAAAAVLLIAVTIFFLINLTRQRDRALASESLAVSESKAAKQARDQQRATALKASEGLAQAAIRAADEGRFADADFRANAAREVMPDGPWGHCALGAVAFQKHDHPTARKRLDEALRLDPSHQPSKAFLAQVLVASGKLGEAEKLAAEADRSSDWRALVAAGDGLFSAQRNRQSIKAYQCALALLEKDPGIPEPTRAELKDKLARSSACLKTQGFWESIRNLPGGEQTTRVLTMMREVYDPRLLVRFEVENNAVAGVHFQDFRQDVAWLDPLRNLPLKSLEFSGTKVRDLSCLKGMPLMSLDCSGNPISDLTPLAGMPLTRINIGGTLVINLGPLKGMRLTGVDISATTVSDLSPLRGMPIVELQCSRAPVRDLRPLEGMPMTVLNCGQSQVIDLAPLKGMPLTWLNCGTTRVTRLDALKGMPLRWLGCGQTGVADLGPLQGMPLEELFCNDTKVTDLNPLKGMPLRRLYCSGRWGSGVADIAPLKGLPLEVLYLDSTSVMDLTPLRGMKLSQFSTPSRKQLTAESLKVVEELAKQGCKIDWTE